ncbi:hypothetical protein J4Q44_G00290380 [Coregonus suidteri]|uniref:Pyrin domain-containing protein n=1 Tax=Coregonus suidteri TaxID=861788 RepID=A0AAN8L8P0_9TELE
MSIVNSEANKDEKFATLPRTSSYGSLTRSREKCRRLETEISRLEEKLRFMKRMLDVAVLLLTTLKEMNPHELRRFQSYLTSGQLFGFPLIPEGQLENADKQVTVDHMVKTYAPNRAVEITLRILRWMDQNDLAEKLERDYNRALLLTTLEEFTGEQLKTFQSDLTSGQLAGFPPIPERQLENAVRQNTVGQMVKRYDSEGAVEITLRILRRMNLDNLAEKLERDYRHRRESQLQNADRQVTVDHMVKTYAPERVVEITLRILRWMDQNDLAEKKLLRDHTRGTASTSPLCGYPPRPPFLYPGSSEEVLSLTSAGSSGQLSSQRPFVLDIPALLLTTLGKLSEKQLKRFLCFLTSGQLPGFPPIPESQLQNADRQVTVDHMVKTYAPERVVEITLRILRWMDQNDLAEKLLRDHTRALLLTTLEEFTGEQLKTFQSDLTSGQLAGFPPIPERQLENAVRQNTVDHMVKRYDSEGAVEITLWILRRMNLDNLAEKLERDYRHRRETWWSNSSDADSDEESENKHYRRKWHRALVMKRPFVLDIPALLLTTLGKLSEEALMDFQCELRRGLDFPYQFTSHPFNPRSQLENADRQVTVDHMVERFHPERALEVTVDFLRRMNLDDLMEKLKRDHTRAWLLNTLEQLNTNELKTFKNYLTSGQLPDCPPIPESQLENADRQVTVGQMEKRYGLESAVKVTLRILRWMNEHDLTEKLQRDHTGPEKAVQISPEILKKMTWDLSEKLEREEPVAASKTEQKPAGAHSANLPSTSSGMSVETEYISPILKLCRPWSTRSREKRHHLERQREEPRALGIKEPVAASKREQKPAGAHNANLPSTSSGMSVETEYISQILKLCRHWSTRSREKCLKRQREEPMALVIKRPFMLDVPALLLTTLEELTEEQLKTFQSNLTSVQLPGFPLIPESQLENTDRQDTVDQMVKRYSPERAVKITLNTMRKMDLGDLAEKLERDHRGVLQATQKTLKEMPSSSSHSPPRTPDSPLLLEPNDPIVGQAFTLPSATDGTMEEESQDCVRVHLSDSLPEAMDELSITECRVVDQSLCTTDPPMRSPENFEPEIYDREGKGAYRFQCPSAGLFQCSITGLVFRMEGEGEVLYRTVPWNRRLLAKRGKRPAGPLFNIDCSQKSVCQLRLPHCEIHSEGGCDFLSVAHVTDDDSMEFLRPHETTETHVILNINGFSKYGITKDMEAPVSPIRGTTTHFSNLLLGTLAELVSEQLETFQWHLSQGVEDFPSIPNSQLENATRQATVDMMVQRYHDDGTVKITLEILRKMGQNKLAIELKDKLTNECLNVQPQHNMSE